MIALLIFSVIGAGIVWWAGRKDAALDPKVTTGVLIMLGVFPVMVELLPKAAVIPRTDGDFPWRMVVAAAWGIGFLISMGRLLWATREIGKWRSGSALVGGNEGVEIRKLGGLKGPVAAGIFRKMIFVPEDWAEWSDERREIVLEHEMAHHRRRDPLRRWIAGFAVAVNWFNPLVRWIVKRLLIQCEFACDAEVLKRGVERGDYAGLLCDLADERRISGAALAMAEKSGLEQRVRRIMGHESGRDGVETGWLIAFAMVMAGFLAVIGAEEIAGYTAGEIEMRNAADPFPGR